MSATAADRVLAAVRRLRETGEPSPELRVVLDAAASWALRSARTQTHWLGCWRYHLDCAVARVEYLELQAAGTAHVDPDGGKRGPA